MAPSDWRSAVSNIRSSPFSLPFQPVSGVKIHDSRVITPETCLTLQISFLKKYLLTMAFSSEYYQNCAPILVKLPESKRSIGRRAMLSERAEFPELFMADMGEVSQGCTTGEALNKQLAIAFPDPGASVDHPEGTQNLFQQQCDGNPRARQRQGQGEGQGPEPIDAPQASQTATTGDNGGMSSTTSLSTASVSTASTPVTTPPLSFTDPTPTTTSDAEPTQTASPGTCTEGYLTCLDDGTHFATCTGGQLTGPQPIAPGFKCKPGSGAGLDISPA